MNQASTVNDSHHKCRPSIIKVTIMFRAQLLRYRIIFVIVFSWSGIGYLSCGPVITGENVVERGKEQQAQGDQKEPLPPQESSHESIRDVALEFSSESPAEIAVEPTQERPSEPRTKRDASDSDREPDSSSSEKHSQETIPERPQDTAQPEQIPQAPQCDLSNPQQDKYRAGSTYFGRNLYIKYVVGTLPIILSSPHGGSLRPSEIKSRTTGVLGGDTNSREYTLDVARRLYQLTGRLPHIIINRLHRSKLDANRAIKEASQGDANSEKAWTEFRDFILAARQTVTHRCKRGHYFDMHTNAHSETWVELGILLSSKDLGLSNTVLDNNVVYQTKSSWKALAAMPGKIFSQLIRGPQSLGSMLQARGYKTVPSSKYPSPNGGGFFNGGYNTASYGSRNGGTIDGTQIESHFSFLKDSKRYNYARALAESILTFVEKNYGFKLRKPTSIPKHSRCVYAKALAFQQNLIDVKDSTWGALAEFVGKLHCGTTVKLNGPQLYYRFKVQAGTKYEISLKANFPARYYLFGDTCDVTEINTQCKASKVNGILAATMQEKKVTYLPNKNGSVRLAIGSRYLHWLGRFHLKIKKLP